MKPTNPPAFTFTPADLARSTPNFLWPADKKSAWWTEKGKEVERRRQRDHIEVLPDPNEALFKPSPPSPRATLTRLQPDHEDHKDG